MANFNNNRDNNRGGGKSFGKKTWENKGDRGGSRSSAPVTLHKATCADCGKICEVPFRPISGKPVYCKDCFANRGEGADRGGSRFPKREFSPSFSDSRDSRDSRFKNSGSDDVVVKQLESLNVKLERLVKAVESLSFGAKVQVKDDEKKELKKVVSSVVKKTLKKKSSGRSGR